MKISLNNMGYLIKNKKEAKQPNNALKGVFILLVEDEELISRMYMRSFEQAGAIVLRAFDGVQATAALDQAIPDIIILDLMMPKLNGFEFLQYLKGREKFSKIPVIIATNMKDRPRDIDKLKELGISDYLTKSDMSLDDLIGRILLHIGK